MKLIRKKAAQDTQIIDLNVLPHALRPADVPPIAVVLMLALFVSVAAVVPLAFSAHSAKQDALAMERQAGDAEQSIHSIQLAVERRRALQAQIDDAHAKLVAMKAMREHLQGGKRPLGLDLSQLLDAAIVPAGGRIISVSGSDTGLRVDGVAAGALDAIAYASKLMNQAGFASARLASFAPGKGGGGQFTVEVTR